VAIYAVRDEHPANQGDVFADVDFIGSTGEGMITAHDCVCDKYLRLNEERAARFVITVAPVHPIDQLQGDWQHYARAGHMPRYFHLPAEGERPELVADLWLEQPVRMQELVAGVRLTSLSPEWLARLWQQFLRLRLGEDYLDFLKELVRAS